MYFRTNLYLLYVHPTRALMGALITLVSDTVKIPYRVQILNKFYIHCAGLAVNTYTI